MSLADPCPSCGHLRRCIDRTLYGVTWRCDLCATQSDETFENIHLLPKGNR